MARTTQDDVAPDLKQRREQVVSVGVHLRLLRNEAEDLVRLLRRYDSRARKLAARFDVIEDLDAKAPEAHGG